MVYPEKMETTQPEQETTTKAKPGDPVNVRIEVLLICYMVGIGVALGFVLFVYCDPFSIWKRRSRNCKFNMPYHILPPIPTFNFNFSKVSTYSTFPDNF